MIRYRTPFDASLDDISRRAVGRKKSSHFSCGGKRLTPTAGKKLQFAPPDSLRGTGIHDLRYIASQSTDFTIRHILQVGQLRYPQMAPALIWFLVPPTRQFDAVPSTLISGSPLPRSHLYFPPGPWHSGSSALCLKLVISGAYPANVCLGFLLVLYSMVSAG